MQADRSDCSTPSFMWHSQRNSRFPVVAFFPLAGFVYLLYHFSGTAINEDSVFTRAKLYAHGGGALSSSFSRSLAWAKHRAASLGGGEAARETEKLLNSLLVVPRTEVGKIAICASIHNEGRFVSEWLLYNRAIGVDRFYLYDTGSTDDTLAILQPWLDAGTVVLHRFNADQSIHYQTNSLQTCSRTYAIKTAWLIDCDIDNFLVVPQSLLSVSRSQALLPIDIPDKPLLRLLEGNRLYDEADVVVTSRVTFKNNGVARLPDEASVLVHQTMRDLQIVSEWDGEMAKHDFTKSLVHTRHRSDLLIPHAHQAQHLSLSPSKVKFTTADGRPVEAEEHAEQAGVTGSLYRGVHKHRAFEPLIMYHYVSRDFENCLAKLRRAKKVNPGSWREQRGEQGCKSYELNQPGVEVSPLDTHDSFYFAATKDLSMSESWFGQNLPSLLQAVHARARLPVFAPSSPGDLTTLPHQPLRIDPHPDLVALWSSRGFDPIWGQSEADKKAMEKWEAEQKERIRNGEVPEWEDLGGHD